MSLIASLRQGLGARLQTITGLRASNYAPDRVSVPAYAIELASLNYDQTFGRRVNEVPFTVRIYTSRADDKAGQDRLDAFIDPTGAVSVKAAIEADTTLGGVAETCRVVSLDNYGVYEVGGTAYFGAEFSVSVWARSA